MENSEMYEYFNQRAKDKQMPYLDKSYADKRRILREYSIKDEIREYVDMMCDEILTTQVPTIKSENQQILNLFNEIINKFGFNNGVTLWHTIHDYLIDGFISLEIIWDKNTIIGFNRLNTSSLVPAYDKELGNYWIQYPNDKTLKRILFDSQIIFISYSSQNEFSKLSYVEGLIKPYNTLSIIENSLLMASVNNATTYQKITIPVKGLSKTRAEEQIGQIIANYSERIELDDTLGTLTINGEKNIPYSKQYWFPDTDSGTPEFTIINNNHSMENYMDSIIYFKEKFRKASKIPNKENRQEEKTFNRFISRNRNIIKEIILKPMKLMMAKNNIEINNLDIVI
jgi:hypothetical protein